MTIIRGPHAVRNHFLFLLLVVAGVVFVVLLNQLVGQALRAVGVTQTAQSQPQQQQLPAPRQPPPLQKPPEPKPQTTNAAFFSGRAADLPQQYRDLLVATGWFEYVRDSNVDVIQLYNWESFAHPDGDTTALATFCRCCRIAQVATHGRSVAEIVGDIVNLTAMFNDHTEHGAFTDAGKAFGTELQQRFLRDARRLARREARQQWDR